MMNRTSILLAILSGLALVWFIASNKDNKNIEALKKERAFAVDNEKDIHTVILTQRNKAQIRLDKKDGYWELNEKYRARKNAVDNLLEVLSTVQIQFIPERAANKNIFDEMSMIGVNVDVYDEDFNGLKSYIVGGSTPDERGTYFMMSGSDQAFVMSIPSIEGSVRGRLIYEEQDWRDRALFRENTGELNGISIEYKDQKDESFSIEKLNNVLLLNDVAPSLIDANKLRAYIENYDEIYAEYIDNNNPLRDSISSLPPFCSIKIYDADNEMKQVKLYPLTDLLYEGEQLTKEELMKMDGRYFADCSWGDFMLVQQRLIGKLLVAKSHFIK